MYDSNSKITSNKKFVGKIGKTCFCRKSWGFIKGWAVGQQTNLKRRLSQWVRNKIFNFIPLPILIRCIWSGTTKPNREDGGQERVALKNEVREIRDVTKYGVVINLVVCVCKLICLIAQFVVFLKFCIIRKYSG